MTELVQYSMFDNEHPKMTTLTEKVDGVEWSYSKRDMYEQCPLRYYFNYYGSTKNSAKPEVKKPQLQFIRQHLTTRYLLSGTALHLAIKLYFRDAKQGKIWSADSLKRFAQKIFRESWNHSRTHPAGDWFPEVEYPPSLLKEYYQGWDNADDLCRVEEARLLDALQVFISNQTFQEFREYGQNKDSLVEASIAFSILGCRINGKVDLAYKVGDEFYIVDWKIGKPDETVESSLQLAIYGLWAVQSLQYLPEKIKVFKAFLSNGKISNFNINDLILSKARIQILKDAERMALMHQYGKNGEADAFTPRLLPAICSNCVYERLCYG